MPKSCNTLFEMTQDASDELTERDCQRKKERLNALIKGGSVSGCRQSGVKARDEYIRNLSGEKSIFFFPLCPDLSHFYLYSVCPSVTAAQSQRAKRPEAQSIVTSFDGGEYLLMEGKQKVTRHPNIAFIVIRD